MKRLMLLAPSMVLLSACSPGPVSLQPGMWETTVQYTSLDLPGAPPAPLAAMRALASRPQTTSSCITPAEAANPAQEMMNPPGNGNACQFSESTFADGVIRVHGTCQAPGRGTAVLNMEGSFTATAIQATISRELQPPAGAPGRQSPRMAGTFNAHRTGDCPA